MRGRTLANAFVILDEAQNTTPMQMKMFLTRLGENSKHGHHRRPDQVDLPVRALNARDRKKDKPTNVLSYPSGERDFLGDMVLARQTVWREAREQRKSPADHFTHLVVHGTLHLLGYDHETGEADAERMEALERRVLARLGIADPYIMTSP
jgi:probable rRNA maturation factor